MSIHFKDIKNDKYEMHNLEFYTKGYLRGYIYGMIDFSNGRTHELLYRVFDPENGESNTLVSIDYRYENPMVDEVADEIENNLTSVSIENDLYKIM